LWNCGLGSAMGRQLGGLTCFERTDVLLP
jgi:hypothetical protein